MRRKKSRRGKAGVVSYQRHASAPTALTFVAAIINEVEEHDIAPATPVRAESDWTWNDRVNGERAFSRSISFIKY